MTDETLESVTDNEETLEEVAAGLYESATVRMPSSTMNTSAYAALLSGGGEQAVGAYNLAQMEADKGKFDYLESLLKNHEAVMGGATDEVVRAEMARTDIDAKVKADVLRQAQSRAEKKYNEQEALREQALADDSPEDTGYDEEVRMEAAIPRTSTRAEEEANAAVLAFNARRYMEGERGEVVGDTAQLFALPLAEQLASKRVFEDFTGEPLGFLPMLGTTQEAFAEYFRTLTPDQLVFEVERLVNYFENEGGDEVLWTKNQLLGMQFLREEIISGTITDTELVINNIVSILDVAGFIPGRVVNAISRMVRGGARPGTPIRALGAANAGRAREAIADIVNDETDEVAQAVAGTDRTTVIADAHLPEIADPDAPLVIGNEKVFDPTRVDSFTEAEKRAKSLELELDFTDFDPELNFGASTFTSVGEGHTFKIGGVYGRRNGGWLTPEDAVSETQFRLRKHGVTEENMTLLRNTERGFEEVDFDAYRGVPGEYKIKVDTEIDMTAMDARDASILGVDYGWLPGMNIVGRQLAKLNPEYPRYLLSPGDLFKEEFINPAFTSVEQAAQLEKELLEIGAEWGRSFSDLSKDNQAGLWEYLQRANAEGWDDSPFIMRGRGLNDEQIEAAQKFRKFWDREWQISNQDKIRTLQSRGFQVLETEAGENYMKLFVRPIAGPQGVPTGAKILDPMDGVAKTIDPDEMKALYVTDGAVAKLNEPIKVNDEWVEYVRVDNTEANYSRGFNSFDEVLEYRPGYYHVKYDAPYYVRQFGKTPEGREFERAIGVAGSQKEAELMLAQAARQAGVDPEKFGRVSLSKESDAFDDEMSLAVSGGRSSQRVRGERIQQGADPNNNADRYVKGPVDAMVNAARSISRRAPTRVYIEGMKQRWVKRFGQFTEKNEFGETVWPTDRSAIGRSGELANDEYAAALQTWEYVRYLENGYVASMDNVLKAGLNMVADIAAKAGLEAVEGTVRNAATNAKIVSPLKGVAFQAYLATNPIRQFVVQGHQATQLIALAPTYVGRIGRGGGLARDFSGLVMGSMLKGMGRTRDYQRLADALGMNKRELDEIVDGFNNSGLTASIDHQNLVESSLHQLLDSSTMKGRGARTAANIANLPRRLGFDAGENVNLMTAWLTMRHLNKEADAGLDLVSATRSWAAKARNFTYQMNRAGDMPYNQNSFGAILQFMQVPHKAMTTMLFNKQLTKGQKVSLAALNVALYGVPTVAIQQLVTNLPGIEENKEAQDMIVHGLEQYAFNYVIGGITNEESDLSSRSLHPFEFGGWGELVRAVASGGLSELWENTPVGALVGGRMADAMVDVTRGLIPWKETEGQPPLSLMHRLESLLSVSSGFSNGFKARAMDLYGKEYSRNGHLLDKDVTTPDVLGKLLGLQSKEAEARFAFQTESYNTTQEIKQDAAEWYRQYKRALMLRGELDDSRAQLDFLGTIWNVYSDPDEQMIARQEVLRLMNRDFQDPDQRLVKSMMRLWGVQDSATFKRQMRDMNLPPETYDAVLKWMDTAENNDG